MPMDPETVAAVQQIVKQAVEQAAMNAASQAAAQVGQQMEQQIADSVASAVSKEIQQQAQTTGATMMTGKSIAGEIPGGTERLEKDQMADSGFLFSNNKLTYDMILNAAIDSIKANAKFVDNAQQEYATHVKNMNGASHQAVQNAVANQDLITKQYLESNAALTKQHLAHRDIATDRTWNIDEQGWQVAEMMRSNTFKDAVAAAASEAVQAMIPTIVAAVGEATKTKV